MLKLYPVQITGTVISAPADGQEELRHVICDDGSHHSLYPSIVKKETGREAPFLPEGSRITAESEAGINMIRSIESITPPQHGTVIGIDKKNNTCTIRLNDSGAEYMAPLANTIQHRVVTRFNALGNRLPTPLHGIVGNVKPCKGALVAFHMDPSTALPQHISVINRPRSVELREDLKSLPAALGFAFVMGVAVPALKLGAGTVYWIGKGIGSLRNRSGDHRQP